MIHTRTESLLTLAEVGGLAGKHVTTVYRWTTTGCRGVVLETIQVGGTRCTSHEAFQRFCERLTDERGRRDGRPRPRTAAAQRATEELERFGV